MCAYISQKLWKQNNDISGIIQYLTTIELLSLDIFDTILFRTVNKPIDVFLKTGGKAIEKQYLRPGLTPKEFQQIRILSESKARSIQKKKIHSIEVNLADIYNIMPDNIGSKIHLMNLELEIEKQCCYLNPDIVSLISYYKERGIPIALLSDMYLSSNQIKDILSHSGFPLEWMDLLLVSNEVGGGKSSGYLFEKLIERYPEISPTSILHIGDNVAADIEGAQKLGISAIHYSVVPTNLHTLFELEQIRYGNLLPEVSSLRKLAYHLTNSYADEEKIWFQLGSTVLGPFLSIFCDWIIDIAIKENKNAIYPFMREGELLGTLLQSAAEARGIDITIKPIYISRQATVLAAMEEMNNEHMESFFARKNFKVKNLFKTLNVEDDLEAFKQYQDVFLHNSHRIHMDENHSLKKALIDFLLEEERVKKINQYMNKSRELLIGYIQQVCGSLDNIITVDIGYKGTIPKFIEKAFQIAKISAQITHLLAIGAEETKYLLLSGIDIRGFAGNAGDNLDLIKSITRVTEPIEQLMNINEGSTMGYKALNNGTIVPITEKSHVTEKEAKMKQICHQGIIEFQKLWFYLCKNKPFIREKYIDNGKEVVKLLHRFINIPTFEEAVQVGNLSVDENYGSDYISQLCTEEQQNLLKKMDIERFLKKCRYGIREDNINFRNIYWPQALVTRQDPYYFMKKLIQTDDLGGYFSIMNDMVTMICEEGIEEIIVYGAGQAGRYLIRSAQMHGLKVSYIVDRKQSLWGTYIEGIEVVSIQQAAASPIDIYAIGSLAFIDEIKNTITKSYRTKDKPPRIFSVQI